jgi:ferritin-like metal-binding protein YciE
LGLDATGYDPSGNGARSEDLAPGSSSRGSDVAERIQEKLVQFIQDAIAMEESVAESLTSMAEISEDPELRDQLERHVLETEEQVGRLRLRLEAHGAGSSFLKEIGGSFQAALRGMAEIARGDRPARTARDVYATEHMEIATYELLERVAAAAGDEETAEVARRSRAEEEAMAAAVAASWDRIVALALRDEGAPL